MSQRVQLLKRRALSNARPGPEAKQAFKELINLGCSRKDTFLDVFPVVVQFFSQYPPPLANSSLSSPSSSSPDALEILHKILGGIALYWDNFSESQQRVIVSCIQKSWTYILAWGTFLVDSYVETDLIACQDPSFGEIAVLTMKSLSFFLDFLFDEVVIGAGELKVVPNVADLVVRVHIYALFVNAGAHASDRFWLEETCKRSSHLMRIFRENWTTFWEAPYTRTLNNLDPRLIAVIGRTLSHLVQRRSWDYNILHPWFLVLSGTLASEARTFNCRLLSHRVVYFVSYFLRRFSKVLSVSGDGPTSYKDPDVEGTWKCSVSILMYALRLSGHESLIVSLDAGVLQASWRLSQVYAHSLYSPTTAHTSPVTQSMGAYECLICLLYNGSLYRSVQRTLEQQLRKWPLNKISTSVDTTQNEVERTWSRFKSVVERRIKLRYAYEYFHGNLCSYPKCNFKASHLVRLFRCSGCKKALYCSGSCQKLDWKESHRQKCSQIGEIPSVDDRDLKLAQYVAHSELWDNRFAIRQKYNESKQKASPTETLVGAVDLGGFYMNLDPYSGVKLRSLDEVENLHPGWDKVIQDLRTLQVTDVEAGPAVVVDMPYQTMATFLIIDEPVVLAGVEERGKSRG